MFKKLSAMMLAAVVMTLVLPKPVSAAITFPGVITVVKHVINDDGGTAVASDFTMTINGPLVLNPLNPIDPNPNSFPGEENPGTSRTVITDDPYTVTESGPAGYTTTFSGDCSGTIAAFDNKTCTVTNDDIAAPPPPPPPPNPCPNPPPPP